MLRSAGALFLTAIEIIRKDLESRAAQYLVALCKSIATCCSRAVCDPAMDLARATELTRQAYRGDPSVDVKPGHVNWAIPPPVRASRPAWRKRLLEIIDAISAVLKHPAVADAHSA